MLVLAHLRNGDTYTRLAAGFQVGVATAGATCRKQSRCSRRLPTIWPPR
ncbi:transposase family protein [Streptomyces mirabilis]